MKKTIQINTWAVWLWVLASALGGREGKVQSPAGFLAEELACNDTINITLDMDCQALLTPDMLLEGELGCLTFEDFEITVADEKPGNGPQVDGCGTFKYEVRRKAGAGCPETDFTYCWGVVNAEDKTPPVVTCPENTDKARRQLDVHLIEGELSAADDVVRTSGGLGCFSELEAGYHYFHLNAFRVTEAGVYSFEVQSGWGELWAGLYRGEFNPLDPCKRLLVAAQAAEDMTGYYFEDGPFQRIVAYLLPGRDYILMTSSRAAAASGAYRWAVYSDGAGRLAGFPTVRRPVLLSLLCEDIDSIYQRPESTRYLGKATAEDNCGLTVGDFEDALAPRDPCDDQLLLRTYTFRDEKENAGSCTQEITIRQPRLADVILPPRQVFLDCSEDYQVDAQGNPSPESTGFPFLRTAFGFLKLTEVHCHLGASYTDSGLLPLCDNSAVIQRTWKITDWCHGEATITAYQTITIGDYVGPQYDCPPTNGLHGDTLVFSTSPFNCFASFEVPLPQNIRDNCSGDWTVEIRILKDGVEPIASFGPEPGPYLATGVPTGQHKFRYIVEDDCGNQTIRDCPFRVEDGIDPVAVCNDELVLSIGGEGLGSVSVEEVDEGSIDNCDPAPLREIRRTVAAECVEAYKAEVDTLIFFNEETGEYFTEWKEKLDFICCEVGQTVKVELRVTDAGGLSNVCWLETVVEDKIAPRCVAPHDTIITCEDLSLVDHLDTTRLQADFGRGKALDNCSAILVELTPELNIDNCATGELIRRFQAVDQSGNRSGICEQRITLEIVHNYAIKFPEDAEEYTCGPVEADSLELFQTACDVLAVNRDTTFFEAEADECYKMAIRYRVINWCEYEEGASPIVVSRDEDGDAKPGDEPVYVIRRPDTTYIDSNLDPGDEYFRIVESVGYWEYTQILKVYDNIPPEIFVPDYQDYFCTYQSTCRGTVDILFDVFDNCTDREFSYTLVYDENDDGDGTDVPVDSFILGRFPKQRISGEFPIGKHSFYLTAYDGCGNFITQRIPFEVIDCKPPAPVCIEMLTVELQALDLDQDGRADAGANTVRAIDFVASDIEDCTGIRYSVNRFGEIPHPDSTSITVTCADPPELLLQLFAWDNAYNPTAFQPDGTIGGPNFDYCIVKLFVQDNQFNLCGREPTADIAGLIATEEGQPLEGVEVKLSGQSSAAALTDEAGNFTFPGLRIGYDYTILPSNDEQHSNGVSTYDLILISKHILGARRLVSPYQLIAADVNRSGSVTTLDLIRIRKLILGTDTQFAGTSSWRFVAANHRFADSGNPWGKYFPELISINDLDPYYHTEPFNFVAVKTGDVNGSAITSAAGLQPRSTAGVFQLKVDDRELEAGQPVEVPVWAPALAEVEGWQFTLAFDEQDLELLDVRPGIAGIENFGFRYLEEGLLTTSWTAFETALEGAENCPSPESCPLFTLVVRARRDLPLQRALRISSRITTAEAYDRQGNILDVAFHFDEHSSAGGRAELLPNEPNPFRSATMARFYLPSSAYATLRVRDLTGRTLQVISQEFDAGYHEVAINRPARSGPGLLLLTLETEGFTASRKMLVVD